MQASVKRWLRVMLIYPIAWQVPDSTVQAFTLPRGFQRFVKLQFHMATFFLTHKDKEKKPTNMPGRLYSFLSCCFFSLPSSSHNESHHGPTLPSCFQLGPDLSNVLSLLPGLISHNSKPSQLILSLQVPPRAGACLNCSDNSHQEFPWCFATYSSWSHSNICPNDACPHAGHLHL